MEKNKLGRLSCVRAMIVLGIVTMAVSAGGTYFFLRSMIDAERQASEASIEKLTATIREMNQRELNRKDTMPPLSRDEDIDALLTRLEKALKICVEERVAAALGAIKGRDMDKLSTYIHPDKGVRLSAYAYVNTKEDPILSADEIQDLMKDPKKRTWGYYDGSGDPIELSGSDYWKEFVYDWDFVNAREIGYNRQIGFGNSLHNAFEIYPNGIVVEYHFSGTKEHEGMDWKSLMLVFEKKDREWYLVGIIHDEWTI